MVEHLIRATGSQWQKLLYSDVAESMLTIITGKPPNKDALRTKKFSCCVLCREVVISEVQNVLNYRDIYQSNYTSEPFISKSYELIHFKPGWSLQCGLEL